MTIACGGKCGRPNCPWTGPSPLSLQGHIGGVKARAEGKGWHMKRASSPPSGPVTGPRVPPSAGGPEARPFYAPLKDLPPGFGKPEDKTASKAAAAPVPAGPLFDSTPWWMALGELLDTTLLAEKKVKIRMDEAKAKRLDASLQAAGWTVTANPNPIAMPFWAPIAITVVGTFALPLLIGYVPDLIKKGKERAEAARRATAARSAPTPSRPTAQVTQRGSQITVTPPPEEEPDEEIRMRVPPPPFQWRAMPWHEPGSA